MKNIKLLILSVGLLFAASCSDDFLETTPTDKTSGEVLFTSVEGAQVAVDGMYRAMFTSGWSSGNEHQNFGNLSTNMFLELMGEDYLQNEMGNGWFYFDYKYDVRRRYDSQAWRSYATWNYYYTLISNANYVIASVDNVVGDPAVINNIKAQALTIRAYSYFYLIQIFQQTYVGNESAPGVPLYTEPTGSSSEGKGRGTVAEVYTQINQDLTDAIAFFDPEVAPARLNESHIDYYVANGILAKVKLVQEEWAAAQAAAEKAMGESSIIPMSTLVPADADAYGTAAYRRNDAFNFNDVGNSSVIWGSKVISDQSGIFASFFSHMDSEVEGQYANASRKCIGNWLYEQISPKDVRRFMWNVGDFESESSGPVALYNQFKFKYINQSDYTGDYIYMRSEEMLLIIAEAQCMQDDFTGARATLQTLLDERVPDYDISGRTDAKTLTINDSNGPTTPASGAVTLLDEIILQRRIELWGEAGRILDIKRLKTGFSREFAGSNHSNKIPNVVSTDPACKDFILTIPQTEFDGNINLDQNKDQNPM